MNLLKKLLLGFSFSLSLLSYTFSQENFSYVLHSIEKGQTLYSIASMYGTTVDAILKLNPENSEKIIVGQKIKIPRQTPSKTNGTYHTIQAGETLYRITQIYNVSAKAICDLNPGLSAENFKIGQVIQIPAETTLKTDSEKTIHISTPQNTNTIQGPVTSKCREMYKTKKGDTVYRICKEFNITEEELLAANPELKDVEKLKKGHFICIPYRNIKIETPAPTNEELFAENRRMSSTKNMNLIKVGVILPFSKDGKTRNESDRMVEYYEGLLLAVDSLKRNGSSFEIYTYNSGTEVSDIKKITEENSALKDLDIIFGPLYANQIEPLAKFALNNKIRLVIPFTSKDNTVFTNSKVYQINTPQSYLYSEVYDHFVRQFNNAHVIFLNSDEKDTAKEEFVKGLKDQLHQSRMTITDISENSSVQQLKSSLRPGKQNIFIPTSGSNLTLIKILPNLVLTTRENPDYEIHLFGYPEWQTYTQDHLTSFFELDTYFYTPFYTNSLMNSSKNFNAKFLKWYGREMEERFPKYGLLGFDTGFYFLKGLSSFGEKIDDHLLNINTNPIQTGLKFERVNNWGGLINKKVYFIRFSKEYELLKLNFD